MIKKFLNRLRDVRKSEEGLSVAEVLVAFSIILGALLSSAMVMGYAFGTQSTNEGRDRAVQIARDYIEESRQVSFTDMAVTDEQSKRSILEDGLGEDRDYNGEQIVILPPGEDSTLTFSPYQEVSVGQYNFRVWTYLTRVQANTFDGTAPHLQAGEVYPKRVTVIVRWDSPNGEQEVVQSWIRNPQIDECIPTSVLDPSTAPLAPAGCRTT